MTTHQKDKVPPLGENENIINKLSTPGLKKRLTAVVTVNRVLIINAAWTPPGSMNNFGSEKRFFCGMPRG